MIALLQGLQNILVALHHLWSFSQLKCSSINFNTSFQWLIILEEFLLRNEETQMSLALWTARLLCELLLQIRHKGSQFRHKLCFKSAMQICKHAMRASKYSARLFPKSAKQLSISATRIWNLPCVFPNPPGNFPNQVQICKPATLVSIQFKVYWRIFKLRKRA